MKSLKTVFGFGLAGIFCLLVVAWNPGSQSFNSSQFSAPQFSVNIKDGALITNPVAWTSFTVNSTNPNSYFGGGVVVSGPQTNLSTLYAPNFVTPTNTPTDGYVVTATGTAGATKWAAGGVGTATNSIYGGVFGTNVGTGQLVIDANGNFAQYGTNPTMLQLKDVSSNVWFAATSSNTTLTVNGTMNLASAGFTNASFLNPPYMSGANITNLAMVLNTNLPGAAFKVIGANGGSASYITNLTGDITLAAFDTSNARNDSVWSIFIRAVADSSTRKVTMPGGVIGSGDGTPAAYYVTNGNSALFQVVGLNGVFTNVSWKPIY